MSFDDWFSPVAKVDGGPLVALCLYHLSRKNFSILSFSPSCFYGETFCKYKEVALADIYSCLTGEPVEEPICKY